MLASRGKYCAWRILNFGRRETLILCENNIKIFSVCNPEAKSFTVHPARTLIGLPQFSIKRFYSSENSSGTIDRLTFNNVCSETLDSLTEYFEELIDSVPHLKNADVQYSDGVLTVHFGKKYGTYVINRQTPNLQIWLSSPTSGPKRYDFQGGTWVYKHDNSTLHSLLDKEIKEIINEKVDFTENCLHSKEQV